MHTHIHAKALGNRLINAMRQLKLRFYTNKIIVCNNCVRPLFEYRGAVWNTITCSCH